MEYCMVSLIVILFLLDCYIVKTQLADLFVKLWNIVKPFLTWRMIVCYAPWWFLATGWAWLFSIIGKGWIRGIALGWLGFMWLPFSCEKVITIPLAIWLHKRLFPKHSVPDKLIEMDQLEKSKRKMA